MRAELCLTNEKNFVCASEGPLIRIIHFQLCIQFDGGRSERQTKVVARMPSFVERCNVSGAVFRMSSHDVQKNPCWKIDRIWSEEQKEIDAKKLTISLLENTDEKAHFTEKNYWQPF